MTEQAPLPNDADDLTDALNPAEEPARFKERARMRSRHDPSAADC